MRCPPHPASSRSEQTGGPSAPAQKGHAQLGGGVTPLGKHRSKLWPQRTIRGKVWGCGARRAFWRKLVALQPKASVQVDSGTSQAHLGGQVGAAGHEWIAKLQPVAQQGEASVSMPSSGEPALRRTNNPCILLRSLTQSRPLQTYTKRCRSGGFQSDAASCECAAQPTFGCSTTTRLSGALECDHNLGIQRHERVMCVAAQRAALVCRTVEGAQQHRPQLAEPGSAIARLRSKSARHAGQRHAHTHTTKSTATPNLMTVRPAVYPAIRDSTSMPPLRSAAAKPAHKQTHQWCAQ